MTDVIEAAKVVGPAASQIANATLLYKVLTSDQGKNLLGPLADYYGHWLARLAERGDHFVGENLGRVISIALRRIPKNVTRQSYASPRIVKRVVDEAVTSTNFITDTYLGCVLDYSVSTEGRDDRGIVISALIRDYLLTN